jgi:hypothetical protein
MRIALAGTPDRIIRSGVMAFPLSFAAADNRADDGLRQVAILAETIRFDRLVAGVAMRIAIPLALYRGVALELHTQSEPDTFRLSLTLVHEDRELDVLLFEAVDDDDITAEWQYWAQRFGLPLLVVGHDGVMTEPFSRLGALFTGKPSPRRLPASLANRRPRFLTRRRTGKLPAEPRIHREREIIARD